MRKQIKKGTKRVMAGLMACMLAVPVALSGCSKTESSEPDKTVDSTPAATSDAEKEPEKKPAGETVTLKWLGFGAANQKDKAEVMEEVNRQLEELLPGVKLEMDTYNTDFAEKWQMALASGEDYDIGWLGYKLNITDEINKGAVIGLNDLIEQYGPNLSYWRDKYPEQWTEINGDVYCIPCLAPTATDSSGVFVPEEYLEYMDVERLESHLNDKDAVLTQDFYDTVADYMQNLKDAGKPFTGFSVTTLGTGWFAKGYDVVNNALNYIGYKIDSTQTDSVKFECIYDTDAYELFVKNMSDWYKKGFIRKDFLSVANPREDEKASGGAAGYFHQTFSRYDSKFKDEGLTYVASSGAGINNMVGIPVIYSNYVGMNSVPFGPAILSTSKHPEEAMQLLNLLMDPDLDSAGNKLMMTITFGIEGKHWKYMEEGEEGYQPGKYELLGEAGTNDDNSYGLIDFANGGIHETLHRGNEEQTQAWVDYSEEKKNSEYHTPVAGFVQLVDMPTQTAQIAAVIKEYQALLMSGQAEDYKKTLEEFRSKLKAAGMDDVVAAVQKQADEYIANHK